MSPASRVSGTWRLRLGEALDSAPVSHSIIGLIALNAAVLGVEASPGPLAPWLPQLVLLDRLLLAVFTLEIALKLIARGRGFFREPWNVFDFAVVGVSLLPATGVLSVLRALRILRALRLVSLVPSMRRVVAALLAALPGMASIVALLVLVLYVAAVMATKLFGRDAPVYFGDLGKSLFTLFQIMTVEGWPDIAREVIAAQPLAWIFFVAYLVMSTFTVLNLFIAVIVNAMQQQVEAEAELAAAGREDALLSELRDIRRELAELRTGRETAGAPGPRAPAADAGPSGAAS